MLTGAHKTQKLASVLSFFFLQRYHIHGDEFLNHFIRVIGDESLFSFFNVETKEKRKRLMHRYSPNKQKKFKQTSTRKLMSTAFWDRKGLLMVEFMQQWTTITSDMYCETLTKLGRAIQNKWRGMLTHGKVLLHYNAHPHTRTAARTRAPL
jgi:hypothetical protein